MSTDIPSSLQFTDRQTGPQSSRCFDRHDAEWVAVVSYWRGPQKIGHLDALLEYSSIVMAEFEIKSPRMYSSLTLAASAEHSEPRYPTWRN